MNYGVNGTGGVDGSGDMGDIYTRLDIENRQQGSPSDTVEGGQSARRWYFDHMRSRVVFTNTGASIIYWEVYECTARKDVPITPEGGTLQQWYARVGLPQFHGSMPNIGSNAGIPNTAYQTSGASRPQATTTGVTPFQFRHFCQNFKITKVTRLTASPGNTVSFDASSPQNVTVNWDDCLDLLAKKGKTKIFLVRQWGVVQTIAGIPQNSTSSAVCEIEKDYNVKMLDRAVPQLNYFTYTNNIES